MCLRRLVCLTLCFGVVMNAWSQTESEFTPATPADVSSDIKSVKVKETLGYQFKIDPVELQVCEELDLAKEHYGRGQWKLAINQLSKFITKQPKHDRIKDALFLRGESYVQSQQFEEAKKDFDQLLTMNPNESQSAHARFRVGEAAMLLGDQMQARRLLDRFRQFHRKHELNAYALPYLAEIVARSGNFDWASSMYSEAIRDYPDGPLYKESLLRSAILDYHQNRFIKASEKLFQLVESKDTESVEYWTASHWLAMCEMRSNREQAAVDRFINLVEAKPDHQLAAASTYRAAEGLRKLKQPEKAIDYFRDVRLNWPDSKYVLQALLGEMQLAKELKKFDRAMELAATLQNLEIANSDTDDTKTRTRTTRLMAEILLAQENYEAAAEKIAPLAEQRGSYIQPNERNSHYRDLFLYALAQRGLKNYSQAGRLLSRIRVDLLDKDFAERVLLARAETLNAAKDYSQAVEAGFRYEGRFPQGEMTGAIRAQMVIGMIGARRPQEATIKFKQLLGTPTIARAEEKQIAIAARYLGEYLYERQDYNNARMVFTMLESVHQDEDDLARAISALAWIEQKSGNTTAAAEKFDDFIARFPKHESITEVRMARAQTLSKSGDREQATEALQFFVDLPADNPMRPRGMYQLAELLHHDEASLPRAEELTERLLADHETFEQRDAALYLLGIIRRLQGDPSAKEPFTDLVENYPKSRYWSDAAYRLAEQARNKSKTDDAKKYLTRLISAERDRQVLPHAIYMKGRIESDARNWSEARETLRKLIKDFPNDELVPVARYGVAESFYQEKEYDRALQLFNILDRERRFQSDEAWGAMVQLRRAELLANKKNYVEAIRIAEKIEERFPDFSLQSEVDYLLGRSYMSRGEFTQARKFYNRVAEGDPNRSTEVSAMAEWMTGESYFHQKKYILAIKAYEAIVADTTYPKWQAASNLQIGKCYELLENFDQAEKYYTRVIERFGTSEVAPEAESRRKIVEQKEKANRIRSVRRPTRTQ